MPLALGLPSECLRATIILLEVIDVAIMAASNQLEESALWNNPRGIWPSLEVLGNSFRFWWITHIIFASYKIIQDKCQREWYDIDSSVSLR